METATDHTPTDAIASTLSGFVHGLRLEQVPPEVSLRARHLMLDAIGCALAARREDFADRFTNAVHALGADVEGGRSAVIGQARRLPLRDAALLNGVLTHGLDYDDTHMAGVIHLSVSVLPAVLALAGQRRASGAEMLVAYIARARGRRADLERDEERPARARLSPDRRRRRVRQQPGRRPRDGPVGQATGPRPGRRAVDGERQPAVHRGRRLDQALPPGLGGAGRHHRGDVRGARHRGAAVAVRRPLRLLSPLSRRSRACRASTSALATADLAADGSASRWEIDNVAIKPFPMCHFVHASADAAIALQRRGVDAARIRSVQVRVPAGVVQAVCEPLANKRRPNSDYDAKFSLPYAVASGLLRGTPRPEGARAGGLPRPGRAGADGPHRATRSMPIRRSRATTPARCGWRSTTAAASSTARASIAAMPSGRCRTTRCARSSSTTPTLHFSRAHAQAVCDQVLALDRLDSVDAARGPAGAGARAPSPAIAPQARAATAHAERSRHRRNPMKATR